MRISFVILNYVNYTDTMECVDSIDRLDADGHDIQIVIVDNHSKNESSKVLSERYANVANVHLILSPKNTGFARGNNLGYAYAKQNLAPDVIACINSDTIIEQTDFLAPLDELAREGKYAVVGPDIRTSTGGRQNPMKTRSYEWLKYNSKRVLKAYFKTFIGHERARALFNTFKIGGMYNPKPAEPDRGAVDRDIACEDTLLQGSALFFMRAYIDAMENAFYPKTFLYFEEDFLLLRCRKYGMLTYYCPRMKMLHKIGGSTEIRKPSDERLRYWRDLRAAWLLLWVMKHGDRAL